MAPKSFQELKAQAGAGFRNARRATKEGLTDGLEFVKNPPVIREKADEATRGGQIIALVFLGPLIVASLAIIEAFNGVLAGVLGTSEYGAFEDPAAFLVTFLTILVLCLVVYFWFQFVRTAGFGWFSWD